jgi:hypothetical protein
MLRIKWTLVHCTQNVLFLSYCCLSLTHTHARTCTHTHTHTHTFSLSLSLLLATTNKNLHLPENQEIMTFHKPSSYCCTSFVSEQGERTNGFRNFPRLGIKWIYSFSRTLWKLLNPPQKAIPVTDNVPFHPIGMNSAAGTRQGSHFILVSPQCANWWTLCAWSDMKKKIIISF